MSILSILDTFLIGVVGGTITVGVLLFVVLSLSDGPVWANDYSVVEGGSLSSTDGQPVEQSPDGDCVEETEDDEPED